MRVEKYIDVYGETGMRYLKKNDANDSVCLPRYFVINSDSFQLFLNNLKTTNIFASLNVKHQIYPCNSESSIPVVNLIFHCIRPHANGSLSSKSDQFIDHDITCPNECGDGYLRDTCNSRDPVKYQSAQKRIEGYNNIYGDTTHIRYMRSADGKDAVKIPRYYSFNKEDILKNLHIIKKQNHQFFYISMGAIPAIKDHKVIANTYVSDLIFHHIQPSKSGKLKNSNEDVFYDVTRPCPDSCD